MAWRLFIIRLISTWMSWSRSAGTEGISRFDRFFHRDVTADDPFLEHLQAILHDFTEIDGPPLWCLPPGKSKELVHRLGDSLDLQ